MTGIPLEMEQDLPPRRRHTRSGRWPSSATTQRAVLDAARTLFASQGYEDTTVDDIVRQSGISVGSIYHQFGGKYEVFLALAQELMSIHADASARAANRARVAGKTREIDLYVAGARAYLMSTWKHRDIAHIMIGEGGPPGYSAARRDAMARFMRGTHGLTIGNPPLADSTAYAVTGLIMAAALQIVRTEERRTARKVADYFTGLLLCLYDARGASQKPSSETGEDAEP